MLNITLTNNKDNKCLVCVFVFNSSVLGQIYNSYIFMLFELLHSFSYLFIFNQKHFVTSFKKKPSLHPSSAVYL